MKTYKKRVVRDCAAAVFPSAVCNVLDAVIGALLTVYISSVLAGFANAVFEMDIAYGMSNFGIILICVLISLFVMPLFGTMKEILLTENSLKHDRMIYGRYLNKKFKEARQFDEGEIQYRLEDDAIDLRCMWQDLVTKFIATPIILGYLLYHSIQISPLYTVIIFGVSAVKLAVPLVTKKLNAKYDKEVREYQAQVRACEFEVLDQPHKAAMYGLTSPLLERFDRMYMRCFRESLRKRIRLSAVTSNLSGMLNTSCTIVILLFGAVLVANGKMTAGSIAAAFGFLSVFDLLFGNISFLIGNVPVFDTLVDRLSVFYTDEEDASGVQVHSFNEITAGNLSFSYDEKPVFQNVNFTVHPGDKVAVCGANGSGKSTLIKVLCGLLKDYSGQIKIDGQELSEISAFSWYDCIAYTEQEPYIFPMSIRENIRIGNLKASDAELDGVIRALEIERLAGRFSETEIQQLSGGEKQKISIARALLKNTPLIIMDEPNNNLDKESLSWLKSFIEQSRKTIIFVSHDDGIVSCADYTINL